MRVFLAIMSLLMAWPALAQSPMNNVSRTITGNAAQSTSDAVGKATASEAQKAEAAKDAEEEAKKAKGNTDMRPMPATPATPK